MFKVKILKLKDVIKILIITITIIFLVVIILKNLSKDKNETLNNNNNEKNFLQSSFLQCLKTEIPISESINTNQENVSKENNNSVLESILISQISSIKGIDEKSSSKKVAEESTQNTENAENNENNANETKESNGEITLAKTGLETEVVTPNPIAETYNVTYNNVKIKNQTDYELTNEILTPDITIENKNIVIFHTHSCESYTSSSAYTYTPTGNFRTTDLNFTVTRVGTELETYLKKYGYNVIHSTDYHDYPSYNGSYTKSLQTVETILQSTPSDIIIDLHRDAIGSRSDYAPTVKIGDEEAAQIMFVIGTNAGGLYHPNWQQNLKFAIKVQEKAEEMYPGLFKPIMLTTSRYNQHTGKFANIMEVGATGNTLDQCLTSMKYLSNVMNEILRD